MKDSVKKLLIAAGVIVVVLGFILIPGLFREVDFHEKYEGYDLTTDVEGAVREGTYTLYLQAHPDAAIPSQSVEVDLTDYVSGEDVEVQTDYAGEPQVLYTGPASTVTWNVNVPEAGFYNLYLEYMTVESRGVPIERSVYINDELPFEKAANITFLRIWKDGGAVKVDNQGNEIRPTQVEEYEWQSGYCRDDMGYVTEPYQFYFEKGDNTLTLKAENEPVVLRRLTLAAVEQPVTYEQYKAANAGRAASGEGLGYVEKIQGETSTFRSESSLYAKYDRSSPTTEPNTVM